MKESVDVLICRNCYNHYNFMGTEDSYEGPMLWTGEYEFELKPQPSEAGAASSSPCDTCGSSERDVRYDAVAIPLV